MEIDDPDNLPLVDRINKAEHFARELCEHLQQAFLPKLVSLRSSSKKMNPDEVSDQTMFDQMSAVVNAEKFASEIYLKLTRYLESIQKDAHEVLGISSALSAIKERKTLVDIQDIVMDEEL
ncbi:MAG: hypothetical protein O2856_13105 [Planctomycetota bacterium]|nr:hypothetical protein [Planctomycetota bacterium]